MLVYFGEGLNAHQWKIIQLTWHENTGFVYDLETMAMERSFTYDQSKEGWGLCNDGTSCISRMERRKYGHLDAQHKKRPPI